MTKTMKELNDYSDRMDYATDMGFHETSDMLLIPLQDDIGQYYNWTTKKDKNK